MYVYTHRMTDIDFPLQKYSATKCQLSGSQIDSDVISRLSHLVGCGLGYKYRQSVFTNIKLKVERAIALGRENQNCSELVTGDTSERQSFTRRYDK